MKNRFFNSSKKKLNTFQNDQCINHTQHKPNTEKHSPIIHNKKFQTTKKLPFSFKYGQQTQIERPKAPRNRTQDLMNKPHHTNLWFSQKEIGIHQIRIVVDNYGFVINENGTNENLKW
ncbi:hypothetical protein M0812_27616 [Anaeramoeba flamelloides]|nr:hypothetical protein M0812_27616 [Anaeramoeba flamelloides]